MKAGTVRQREFSIIRINGEVPQAEIVFERGTVGVDGVIQRSEDKKVGGTIVAWSVSRSPDGTYM